MSLQYRELPMLVTHEHQWLDDTGSEATANGCRPRLGRATDFGGGNTAWGPLGAARSLLGCLVLVMHVGARID